jgi:hypothetical protein
MRQLAHGRLAHHQNRAAAPRFPDSAAANDAHWALALALAPQRSCTSTQARLPEGSGLVIGSIVGLLCWIVLLAGLLHAVR